MELNISKASFREFATIRISSTMHFSSTMPMQTQRDPIQDNDPWVSATRLRGKIPPPLGSFAIAGSFSSERTASKEAATFHQVKGRQTWGLVFDPGAAHGLAGTQSLLEYFQSEAWPAGKDLANAAAGRFTSYARDRRSTFAGQSALQCSF